MIEAASIYIAKAEESLAGAESEFVNGRYNNCANRCYYACFQAAIHALARAGIQPSGPRTRWGHEFVQAEFVGQLINRRKVFPADLRGTLFRNLNLRHEADYATNMVNRTEASRAFRRSRQFVEAIRSKEGDQV